MASSNNIPSTASRVSLSIVVPIYNDIENIDPFLNRAEQVVANLGCSYEIVCVDDGSTDASLDRMIDHHHRNPAIKVVGLSRNFGKDVALSAGLDHSTGDAVVAIDVDLQDPPELIPDLFAKWREGYDVVYAKRISRAGESVTKQLTASWFYRVHNLLADINIPADTGDFRLMDRRVVDALRRLPERNRFMKVLFSWVGFRQTGVEYRRDARGFGTSKWRYWRLWNFALDGITSSSTLPLRIWSYIGIGISVVAFAYALLLVFRTLVLGVDVPGYASLMVAVLFMGGINLLTLGIIGEYIGRTYVETKNRPLYVIRESLGFDSATQEDREWIAKSTPVWLHSKMSTGGS
jgi:glycosyltransferase involved in cell wall biosynthesis